MQYLRDQAFILRRINFGDSDRYVTLFTKNHGKQEVIAKGVRKITSRRAGSIELLNLVEFQAVRTAKNYILTEVKLVSSFDHLKRELENIKKVFLMCELIDATLAAGVANEEIFDLVSRAANHIQENDKNMSYFQAKLLSLLGFWDGTKAFKNEDHVHQYFEQIIERRLKTPLAFSV